MLKEKPASLPNSWGQNGLHTTVETYSAFSCSDLGARTSPRDTHKSRVLSCKRHRVCRTVGYGYFPCNLKVGPSPPRTVFFG